MSSEEIKSVLHESIENIDDNDFLLSVKELIDVKYNSSKIHKISDSQMKES